MIKLSIVIPVYGVEKYIEECFISLIHQMTDEVELVFIDDGTKDDSVVILNNLLKEYGCLNQYHIKIISQNNGGQSKARNFGIKNCKGEYIGFIDPDDFVLPNYISTILKNIRQNIFDILHFNAYTLKKNKLKEMNFIKKDQIIITDEYYIEKLLKKQVWFSFLRVVHKKLLKEDFFPVGILYEDMIAFSELYVNDLNIKEISDHLYVYRVREGSSAHTYSEKLMLSTDYGLNYFNNNMDYKAKILYKQFVKIKIYNMMLGRKRDIEILNWYLKNIFSNNISIGYKKPFLILYYLLIWFKFKLIFFKSIF